MDQSGTAQKVAASWYRVRRKRSGSGIGSTDDGRVGTHSNIARLGRLGVQGAGIEGQVPYGEHKAKERFCWHADTAEWEIGKVDAKCLKGLNFGIDELMTSVPNKSSHFSRVKTLSVTASFLRYPIGIYSEDSTK
jgi:hypothetical protein